MVEVQVVCVVRSPYGVPGDVRVVERSARVEHYLRVGVLFEVPPLTSTGLDADGDADGDGDGGEG